jgi:phosphoserine aminotransferase
MRAEYLPELIKSVSDEFMDYKGTGISIIETSHRNKYFGDLNDKCFVQLRKFLKVPKDFTIMWFQGEVEFQYAVFLMNMLPFDSNGKCTAK